MAFSDFSKELESLAEHGKIDEINEKWPEYVRDFEIFSDLVNKEAAKFKKPVTDEDIISLFISRNLQF